jgi:hypothetical protein
MTMKLACFLWLLDRTTNVYHFFLRVNTALLYPYVLARAFFWGFLLQLFVNYHVFV